MTNSQNETQKPVVTPASAPANPQQQSQDNTKTAPVPQQK